MRGFYPLISDLPLFNWAGSGRREAQSNPAREKLKRDMAHNSHSLDAEASEAPPLKMPPSGLGLLRSSLFRSFSGFRLLEFLSGFFSGFRAVINM